MRPGPLPINQSHDITEKIEPPDLQQLVLDHGGKITEEAWKQFDAEMAEWKADVRSGALHRV